MKRKWVATTTKEIHPKTIDDNMCVCVQEMNMRRGNLGWEPERGADHLGDCGEPAYMKPSGGGGGGGSGGGVADKESNLGQVELGSDGLHPPLIRRGRILTHREVHGGGVSLE